MPKTASKQSVPMFKSIRLRNFKAYKDSGDIPLKPLTVLVGANNAGKSSLLQALLLLKQTVEDRSSKAALVTSGPIVDLGGFSNILHKGHTAKQNTFSISLTVDNPEIARVQPPSKKNSRKPEEIPMGEQFDVEFGLNETSKTIQVSKCVLWQKGKSLLTVENGGKKWSSEVYPTVKLPDSQIEFLNFFPTFPIGPSHRTQRISDKGYHYLMLMNFQHWAWTHLFSHLHRVGPLRVRVPWYGQLGSRTYSDLGPGGENLISALGSDEVIPSARQTLLHLVNSWMSDKDKLGILKRLHLEPLGDAEMFRTLLGDDTGGVNDINIAAMGEGTSQLLPIVARALASGVGDCLLIEQPEIHLHPALQSSLADLLIEVTTRYERQIIVETHSEHLLLRLRRRIAEGKAAGKNGKPLTPDDVAILYVEKDGPASTVRQLNLDARGHFGDWPKGFFEEAYREAMALAVAGMRKPE